jgi:hypothetical protein
LNVVRRREREVPGVANDSGRRRRRTYQTVGRVREPLSDPFCLLDLAPDAKKDPCRVSLELGGQRGVALVATGSLLRRPPAEGRVRSA